MIRYEIHGSKQHEKYKHMLKFKTQKEVLTNDEEIVLKSALEMLKNDDEIVEVEVLKYLYNTGIGEAWELIKRYKR